MYNITLISTVHSERGICNSKELYRIMTDIAPEVIFEEIPENLFEVCYDPKIPMDVLEVKCIRDYLEDHPVKHFPVDIDVSQSLSNAHIDYMLKEFGKYDAYRKIEQEQVELTEKLGFDFLNSKRCAELFAEKFALEKQLIGFSGHREFLANFHKLFYEEHSNREDQMIGNIYRISRQNAYRQAVCLLGSGHRASFEQKVARLNEISELKLSWTFYGENVT